MLRLLSIASAAAFVVYGALLSYVLPYVLMSPPLCANEASPLY